MLKDCKIIWDPILSSSSGYVFHDRISFDRIKNLSKKLHLITPNYIEAGKLNPENKAENTCEQLSHFCSILLKGGHTNSTKAKDVL